MGNIKDEGTINVNLSLDRNLKMKLLNLLPLLLINTTQATNKRRAKFMAKSQVELYYLIEIVTNLNFVANQCRAGSDRSGPGNATPGQYETTAQCVAHFTLKNKTPLTETITSGLSHSTRANQCAHHAASSPPSCPCRDLEWRLSLDRSSTPVS